jgi:deoxyribodipyrimidine photo-lyase
MVDARRVRALNTKSVSETKGPVIYWMSRDQRATNNWALLYAQERARELDTYVIVAFTLVTKFLEAPLRAYDFMLKGLIETEQTLQKYNIPFILKIGEPASSIQELIKRDWKAKINETIDIPFFEVDAHNIVPCWIASEKQEYAAHTIRKKLHAHLNTFLVPYETLTKQEKPSLFPSPTNWDQLYAKLAIDTSIKPVTWLIPGTKAALQVLSEFFSERLPHYATDRNDPNKEVTSQLSSYLHFGQISAQEVVLALHDTKADPTAKDAFIEQIFVRKELTDNFCYYNQTYDSFDGLPDWAKKTLDEHANDPREYLYSYEELENAQTHDELWNAAQLQMKQTGIMHNYMRMYWAKKILEWTRSPHEAIAFAIRLNDTYELDGRDPNGYVGILWSIGGLHDRPWFERAIYGKVRFLSYNGAKRKFDISSYTKTHTDKIPLSTDTCNLQNYFSTKRKNN